MCGRSPLAVLVVCSPFLLSSSTSIALGQCELFEAATLSADFESSDVRFGSGVAADGDTAIFGAPGVRLGIYTIGAAYVYRQLSGEWQLTAVLTPPELVNGSSFGASVAIRGDTMAIGAPADNDNGFRSGAVYVFRKIESAWRLVAKLTPDDAAANDRFGTGVAVDGGTVVVGTPYHSTPAEETGAAYIFQEIDGTWQQTAAIASPAGGVEDHFGVSVAVSGTTVAVGAEYDDSDGNNRGSVYLYHSEGASWQQRQQLVPTDDLFGGAFGRQLSMNGDTLAITMSGWSSGVDIPGAVYVYRRESGEQWQRSTILMVQEPSLVFTQGIFARSVAVSGDRLVAGAIRFNHGRTAYCFRRIDGEWKLVRRLATQLPRPNAVVSAVAVTDDTVFVGDSLQSVDGTRQGIVYQYDHVDDFIDCNANNIPDACDIESGDAADCNGNGIPDACDLVSGSSADCNGNGFPDECEIDGQWEVERLTASDASFSKLFGNAVAVSGNTAIVGATAYSGPGYGGEPGAYIFRFGGDWIETAKLEPADEPTPLNFGVSVELSGDTAVIGASYDNEAGNGAGSAFVFREIAGQWTQIAKLTASDAEAGAYFGYSVAIDGGTIVVGAYAVDDGSAQYAGAAYVLEEINGAWQETARLSAPADGANHDFGLSVAIQDNLIAVGAPLEFRDYNDIGSVYLFEKTDGNWALVQQLPDAGVSAFPGFGVELDIDGNTMVVGAAYAETTTGDSNGRAYVFHREADTWQQVAFLNGDGEPDRNLFGAGVAVSGDTIAVSDFSYAWPTNSSDSVTIFRNIEGEWLRDLDVAISDPYQSAGDRLGASVALDGDVLFCGARSDVGFTESGAVYVYDVAARPLQGDLDDNGNIDADDASIFINVLLGNDLDPLHFSCADTNCNGRVDGRDLQSFTSGWLTP